MADRQVTWKALADFASISREARKSERALDDLDRAQAKQAATATASSQAQIKANDDATRSTVSSAQARTNATKREETASRGLIGAIKAVAAARRESAGASREQQQADAALVSAQDRQTQSAGRNEAATLKLAASRDRAEQSARKAVQAEQNLVSAQERSTNATKAAEQTAAALAVARQKAASAADGDANAARRVAQAEKEHASAAREAERASSALANAQDRVASTANRVQQSQNSVAQATAAAARSSRELESANQRVSSAQSRASSAGDNHGGSLRRLGKNFDNAANKASGFALRIGGAGAKFGLIATGISVLIPLLSQLVAGLTAVASAAGASVGILGALPGLAMGAATGIGTLIAGFSGIGEAVKAAGQQQAAAGGQAKQSASQHAAAAERIRDAQQGLKDAREEAARSAQDSARQVADAVRGAAEANEESADRVKEAQRSAAEANAESAQRVRDVRENAARQAVQAAKRVSDAERSAAEATKQAAQQVKDAKASAARANQQAAQQVVSAEKSLVDAQKNARAAQLDLNSARKDAVQHLHDMKDAVRDAAYGEEDAVLGLEEARRRLAQVQSDPNADWLEYQRAELAYRQAQSRLEDAREAKVKTQAENAEAQRKGVAGSDIMVAAQNRARAATEAVADANNRLGEAQREQSRTAAEGAKTISAAVANQAKVAADGAASVREAQAQQSQQARESARAVSDALKNQARTAKDGAKSVAEAVASQVKTARDGARSVADAQRAQADQARNSAKSVQAAQRALAQAMKKSADSIAGSGVSAVNKYAEAMKNLSPAGRRFVKFLVSLKPKLDQLKRTAQEGLLPGVQDGLQSLMKLFPLVNRYVGDTARQFGGMARSMGKTLTTAESQKILGRVFATNSKALKNYTAMASPLIRSMLRIMDAARPLTLWISKLGLAFARWTDRTTKANTENGKMVKFFGRSQKSLATLGRILRNIGGIFLNVGKAGSDSGFRLLGVFEKWTAKMREFTGSVEGQNKLKKWFKDAEPGIIAAFRLIGNLGKAFARLGTNDKIAPLLDKLAGPGVASLERFFKALGGSTISGDLVDGLISITDSLSTIFENGGGGVFAAFVKTFAVMASVIETISKFPGVAPILSGIAVALGAYKAVRLIGAITGINGLVTAFKRLRAEKSVKVPQVQQSKIPQVQGRAAPNSVRAKLPRVPTADAAGKASATRAGSDVGQGFVNGINSKVDDSAAAARGLGRTFLVSIKKMLGIKSPSTVMTRVGADTGQGFVLGVRSKIDDAAAVGRQMKAAMVKAASGAVIPAPVMARGPVGGKGGKGAKKQAPEKRQKGGAAGGKGGRAGAAADAAGMLSFLPGAAGMVAFMVTSLAPLLTMIPGISAAFSAMGAAIAAAIWPITAVIAVVAALVGLFVLLYQRNEAFRNAVTTIWGEIQQIFTRVWAAIQGAVATAWGVIRPILAALGNILGTVLAWTLLALWNTVKFVFTAIGTIISWSWKTLIQPAFSAFYNYVLGPLGSVIKWLYNNVAKPVFSAFGVIVKAWWSGVRVYFAAFRTYVLGPLGAVIRWLYNNVAKPVFRAFQAYVKWWWGAVRALFSAFRTYILGPMAAVIRWLYNNVAKPVFRAIHAYVKWWWGAVRALFSAFRTYVIGPLAAVIRWLYNNVAKPVFRAIHAYVKWWWGVVKAIFNAFRTYIYGSMAKAIRWLRDSVVKPVFRGIYNAISSAWSSIYKKLKAFRDYLTGTFSNAFRTAKSSIKKAWDGIKSVVGKPVKWVINTVIKGITGRFDWLVDKLGGKPLNFKGVTWKFADGGMVGRDGVPSYATGGRVRGQSLHKRQDNIPANLTAGEYVQPVDTVKHYGARAMEAIRRRRIPKRRLDALMSRRTMLGERFDYHDGGMAGQQASKTFTTNNSTTNNKASSTVNNHVPALRRSDVTNVPFRDGLATAAGGGYVGENKGRPGLKGKLIQLGRMMQKKGISVGQHRAFGSNYRYGRRGGSLHGYDLALDINGPGERNGQFDKLARSLWNAGWGVQWKSPGHYDHMHVDTGLLGRRFGQTRWQTNPNASKLGGTSGKGLWGKFTGALGSMFSSATEWAKDKLGGLNPVSWIKDKASNLLKPITKKFGNNKLTGLLKKIPGKVLSNAVGKVKSIMDIGWGKDDSGGGGSGAGAERWRGVATKALEATKQSKSLLGRLLHRIGVESGGDPGVVNKWDSNWRAGHPSVGLMQVIRGTYRAHKHPKYDKGPYKYGVSVNPMANITAAIRYTKRRYGNFSRWGGKRGYAEGGPIPGVGNTDSVPAMLMPGEFVIRKQAAAKIGRGNLHALNNVDRPGRSTSRRKASAGGVQYFASGGEVYGDEAVTPNFPGKPPPKGPIGGMKPGSRLWVWKLVRTLFRLPIGGYQWGRKGVAQDQWDSRLTKAFRAANGKVPTVKQATAHANTAASRRALFNDIKSFAPARAFKGRGPYDSPSKYPPLQYGSGQYSRRAMRSTRVRSKSSVAKKAIQMLQRGLLKNNEITKTLKVDGMFGKHTRAVVKRWQKGHGWKQTGKVGRQMWRSLGMDEKPKAFQANKPIRVYDVARRRKNSIFGVSPILTGKENRQWFDNRIEKARTQWLYRDIDNLTTGRNYVGSMINSLSTRAGMGSIRTWSDSMSGWIRHIMQQGLGEKTDTIFPPWWDLDPLQDGIEKQDKTNSNLAEFLRSLETLSKWGLTDLVTHLQEKGVDEGLDIARSAVGSRANAETLNKQLKDYAAIDATSGENYTKFIASALTPGANKGIREIARELGVADYSIMDMWDELLKSGRLKAGGTQTRRLEREIEQFRSGMFYANSGGRVPGTGNRDTVPAMLTPGEFVLRKDAVRALGLDNVRSLNTVQKFAQGGPVFSVGDIGKTMPDLRTDAISSQKVSATKNVNIENNQEQNFYTTIHNPVREPSSRSVNKELRKLVALGGTRKRPNFGIDSVEEKGW